MGDDGARRTGNVRADHVPPADVASEIVVELALEIRALVDDLLIDPAGAGTRLRVRYALSGKCQVWIELLEVCEIGTNSIRVLARDERPRAICLHDPDVGSMTSEYPRHSIADVDPIAGAEPSVINRADEVGEVELTHRLDFPSRTKSYRDPSIALARGLS